MQIGSTVGNYRITGLLGQGGMGQVFVAEHPLIGKKVALKVLRADLARDPEAVARFFTEARAIVRVGHENIVDISDFGQTPDGQCYFIMELLAGKPLTRRLIECGLMDWRETLHIGAQVAAALAAAHVNKILHRDLKPDNIFLVPRSDDPTFVKVLDFGLAKLSDGVGSMVKTHSGVVLGTPHYMSPEQCEGAVDIDARTDVYSLGVILYQCLTGQVPFAGENYAQVLAKHLTSEATPPRALRNDLPPAVDALVLRAMARRREERFQSMADLREAARRLLDAHDQGPGVPRHVDTAPASFAPVPVNRTRVDRVASPIHDAPTRTRKGIGVAPIGAGEAARALPPTPEPTDPGGAPSWLAGAPGPGAAHGQGRALLIVGGIGVLLAAGVVTAIAASGHSHRRVATPTVTIHVAARIPVAATPLSIPAPPARPGTAIDPPQAPDPIGSAGRASGPTTPTAPSPAPEATHRRPPPAREPLPPAHGAGSHSPGRPHGQAAAQAAKPPTSGDGLLAPDFQ